MLRFSLLACFLTYWAITHAQPSVERANDGCLTFAYWRIDKYADSLNFADSEHSINEFIDNLAVDQNTLFHKYCLEPFHKVSFRKSILDRIINLDALNRLAESPDRRLDKLVDWKAMQKEAKKAFERNARKKPEPDSILYMQHSLRTLIKRRIKEIEDGKRNPPESKSCWEWSDFRLNLYADSLNHWSIGNPLPRFLSDKFLDLKLQKQLNQCTVSKELISYRREVLYRVVNADALGAVAGTDDPALSEKVTSGELANVSNFKAYPYLQFSTGELARMRLDDLDKVNRRRLKN